MRPVEVSESNGVSPLVEEFADGVRRNPQPLLAAALLVGLVTGAGLWPRLGRAMLGAGIRLALSAVAPPVFKRIFDKREEDRQ